MTITFELAWWMIPTAVTLIGLVWALFIVDGGGGYMSSMANLFALVPALGISAIAWIIAGFLK